MSSKALPARATATHRENVVAAWDLDAGAVLIPSGLLIPVAGTDGYHGFHVHAEHYYLTGAASPGQVLAFDPGEGFTLFVHVPDADERVWEGDGVSPEEARERSGIERVRPRAELGAWLISRAGGPIALLGDPDLAVRPEGYGFELPDWIEFDGCLGKRLGAAVTDCRRRKTPDELDIMRESAAVAAAGHVAGIRATWIGMSERRLAVEIESEFLRLGAARPAYSTIVGSGPNGAVLHYAPSDRALGEGELVLVDAGAEVGGYMSDITRTFPAGTKFSPEQRDVYEVVLAVQEEAIAKARPGKEYRELHLEACVTTARGLADLGILRGDPEDLVARDAHALFFPHGLGHMIGLVTHDVGGYGEGRTRSDRFGLKYLRTDLPLAAGHVVTIEPGIYFVRAILENAEFREKYKDDVVWDRVDGMLDFGGIRIEDDVHVSEGNPEVLSSGVPKDVAGLEALRAEGGR